MNNRPKRTAKLKTADSEVWKNFVGKCRNTQKWSWHHGTQPSPKTQIWGLLQQRLVIIHKNFTFAAHFNLLQLTVNWHL